MSYEMASKTDFQAALIPTPTDDSYCPLAELVTVELEDAEELEDAPTVPQMGAASGMEVPEYSWENGKVGEDPMENFLYGILDVSEDTLYEIKVDQEERAFNIVRDIKDSASEIADTYTFYELGNESVEKKDLSKIETLVMMDGHGRMLWQILKQCKEQEISNLEILIYELDEDMHQWHEKFFPKNLNGITIKCIKGDIFDADLSPSKLVYYNFLSIGKQIHKLLYRLSQNAFKGIQTYFSYQIQYGTHTDLKLRELYHANKSDMRKEIEERQTTLAEPYDVDSRTSKKQMQKAFLDNFGPSQISAFSYFDYYIRLKRQFEYDKHAYFGWLKDVGIVRYTTRFVSQRAYFCTFKLRLGDSIDDYDDGLHEYEGELPRYRGKQRKDDWNMDNIGNHDVVVVNLARYQAAVKPDILNFLFSCVDVSQLKVGSSEMSLDQITLCINMMYVFEKYISVKGEKDVLKVCVMRAINLLKRYHREKFKKVYHNLERLDSIEHYFRSEELDRIRNNKRPAALGDASDVLVTPKKSEGKSDRNLVFGMSRLRF